MPTQRENVYFTFAPFEVPIHFHIIPFHSEMFTFKKILFSDDICRFAIAFYIAFFPAFALCDSLYNTFNRSCKIRQASGFHKDVLIVEA